MENLLKRLREKMCANLGWVTAEICTAEAITMIQDMIDDLDYMIEFLTYYEKHIEERLHK